MELIFTPYDHGVHAFYPAGPFIVDGIVYTPPWMGGVDRNAGLLFKLKDDHDCDLTTNGDGCLWGAE
jgi:hypothetical protein